MIICIILSVLFLCSCPVSQPLKLVDLSIIEPPAIEVFEEPISRWSIELPLCDGGSLVIQPKKEVYEDGELVCIKAQSFLDKKVASFYAFNDEDEIIEASEAVLEFNIHSDMKVNVSFLPRKWTFLVYMAADNDLESAALADFNELEQIPYDTSLVDVLVLLDRSPYYDSTNENWVGTRLYKLCFDDEDSNYTLISERLLCPDIGIPLDGDVSLNTADPFILKDLLCYMKREFPAEYYGLIMWGHGAGWKSEGYDVFHTRATAFDDTSDDYMHTTELHYAISEINLDIVGFDTCFSSMLESLYEICDDTSYVIGCEGIQPSSGWDYKNLFTRFCFSEYQEPFDFCNSAVSSFKECYEVLENPEGSPTSISVIDCSMVKNLSYAFESFSSFLCNQIKNISPSQKDEMGISLRKQKVDEILALFFSVKTDWPYAISGDKNIDIGSLCSVFSDTYQSPDVFFYISELQAALEKAVIKSWFQEDIGLYGMSVHFCPFKNASFSGTHDQAYLQGSGAPFMCSFVKESTYWVPHYNYIIDENERNLLDWLFYSSF